MVLLLHLSTDGLKLDLDTYSGIHGDTGHIGGVGEFPKGGGRVTLCQRCKEKSRRNVLQS